jgi:putative transposase
MPRQPRFVLPDLAVHIVQRGHNRAPCFVSPRDYELYLLHARELAVKFQCVMHAYCLMPNHVHMLMTPPSRDACGLYMRQLGQRYVQYFNRRYRRTGSLWEGRFKSCIVDTARYVLACYRYIEMNPVQPALVERPQDYQWSSFTINAGWRADPFISPHPEYLALGLDAQARSRAYLALFERPVEGSLLDEIREATNAGHPLGGDGAWAPSPVTG